MSGIFGGSGGFTPPGTASQLLAGDGTAAAVGGGLVLSAATLAIGGGAAPAIDANHLHVWACEDAVGSATLADTGAVPVNLTLAGTAWADYVLSSSGLYLPASGGGRKCARFSTRATGNGAFSTACATAVVGAITIEAFLQPMAAPTGYSLIASVGSNSGVQADIFWIAYEATNGWMCNLSVNGTTYQAKLAAPMVPLERYYVVGVYDKTANPTLKLYVNGVQIATNNTYSGNVNAFAAYTQASISNVSSGTTNTPANMRVSQVRVSQIARQAAYVTSTYATLLAM